MSGGDRIGKLGKNFLIGQDILPTLCSQPARDNIQYPLEDFPMTKMTITTIGPA